MPRTYKFMFTVECATDGEPDLARAEEMIGLLMQELVMDDEFVLALDEKEAVSIETRLVK